MPQTVVSMNTGVMPQTVVSTNTGVMPQRVVSLNTGVMSQRVVSTNTGVMPQTVVSMTTCHESYNCQAYFLFKSCLRMGCKHSCSCEEEEEEGPPTISQLLHFHQQHDTRHVRTHMMHACLHGTIPHHTTPHTNTNHTTPHHTTH